MGTDAGFGGLLRRERVLRGLTQEQLAEAAGLASRSIRSLEAGRTQPRRSTVTLLCDALDLDRGKRQALLRACGFADRSVKTEPERDGPATLPRDIPDFVGRSGLLETLRDRLLSGTETATRIVAINGLGGIGKTTLAVHLAHQVRAAFADGQLFADLEGGSGRGRDPDAVLGSMLADLGVAPERLPAGRGSRSALLRSLTADRSLLFLLDNAADTAQVRALLPSSASCAVLVTSRRYLAALEGAHHATVGPFTSDQSRTLLTAVCAPALRPGDEDGVARIIDCCAGLPLALRIAGAQLAAPSSPGATALAAQLSEAARRLDGFTAEDLSVRSTLAASVESLDVADPVGRLARSALFFLGRWPGGAVGAQCTAAALGTTSQRARQALDHLADMSLLQTKGPDRYIPHDLVKLFMSEQAPDTRADPLSAVFDWYLQAMDRAVACFADYFVRPELPCPGPTELPAFAGAAEAVRWCEDEYDNLVALVRYGATAGWDARTCRLAILAMPFGEQHMRWPEWIETHRIGLDCAHRGRDLLMAGRCASGLASAYRWTGEFALALEHSDLALAIFTKLGDRERIGVALVNRARIPFSARDYPAAVAAAREAVDYLRVTGEPFSLATALNHLGMALARGGDPEAALPHHLESIVVAERAGLNHSASVSLLNLSVAYRELGRLAEADRAIERAAAIADGLGLAVLEAEILRQTGEVRHAQGRLSEATVLLRRSLDMMDDVGYPEADDVRRRLAELTAAPSSLPYPLLMRALLEARGGMHGGGCRGQHARRAGAERAGGRRGQASDNKGYGSFHGRALLLQRVQIEQIQVKKIRAAQNRKQGRKLAGSSTRRRTR
jgi:tetratricopeptide (TPR) repeat protein/transcriptional regulator with XRE-family HTH domain